jgi:hypothetical protein
MRYTILISFISLLFISCNKDKFSTRPQLKYKSVNTNILSRGQIIIFSLSFTDAEGDLEDSIYVEKIEPTCPNSNFDAKYKIPVFPLSKNLQGDLEISYGYNVPNYPLILGPQCMRNDTCFFRFVLKDKAQNKSDTVNSETIVIIN